MVFIMDLNYVSTINLYISQDGWHLSIVFSFQATFVSYGIGIIDDAEQFIVNSFFSIFLLCQYGCVGICSVYLNLLVQEFIDVS